MQIFKQNANCCHDDDLKQLLTAAAESVPLAFKLPDGAKIKLKTARNWNFLIDFFSFFTRNRQDSNFGARICKGNLAAEGKLSGGT